MNKIEYSDKAFRSKMKFTSDLLEAIRDIKHCRCVRIETDIPDKDLFELMRTNAIRTGCDLYFGDGMHFIASEKSIVVYVLDKLDKDGYIEFDDNVLYKNFIEIVDKHHLNEPNTLFIVIDRIDSPTYSEFRDILIRKIHNLFYHAISIVNSHPKYLMAYCINQPPEYAPKLQRNAYYEGHEDLKEILED